MTVAPLAMFKPTICWSRNGVRLIDQTQLPRKTVYLTCPDVHSLWEAIRNLRVRGAPAIGQAAAYAVVLGCRNYPGDDLAGCHRHLAKTIRYVATARPTAVNLFYALDRMAEVIKSFRGTSVKELRAVLLEKAQEMYRRDQEVCRKIGRNGARLIKKGSRILTVCNAGALATVDYGTALGVFYAAREKGKTFSVIACETRPLLQGARLTTWELTRAGIDVTLICDNMAAGMMKQGKIDAVITGADRITRNGDTANKIGTYALAVLARYHQIPFYVAAPMSTVDPDLDSGDKIPIEERHPDEVRSIEGVFTAPRRVPVYNPAFDVTPAELITALITEKGILQPDRVLS